MTRKNIFFYSGIALWALLIPLNHIDKLFPTFTTFSILGNSYQFIDGYTSVDVIWVLVQKINLIIAGIGTLLMLRALKDTLDFKKGYLIFKYTFIVISLVLLYMAVDALRWYITDFTWKTSIFSYIMVLGGVVEFGFLINMILRKSSRKQKEKKEKLIQLAHSLQANHLSIINDVNVLENIPSSFEEGNFMEAWDIVARNNARKAYKKIAINLRKIDQLEKIE